MEGDIIHGKGRVAGHEALGMGYAVAVDKLVEGYSHLLIDGLIDIGAVGMHHLCQVVEF